MLDQILSGFVIVAPVVIGVAVIFVPSKTDDAIGHKRWVSGLLMCCIAFSVVTGIQLKRAATDSERVAKNVERAVNTLSGADSYPCVMAGAVIDGRAILSVHNMGPNTLTGVNLKINRLVNQNAPPDYFFDAPVSVGTLAQNGQSIIAGGLEIHPDEVAEDGIARYVIETTTQNGAYYENLWFKQDPVPQRWTSTYYGYTDRHKTSLPLPGLHNGDFIELSKCRSKDLFYEQSPTPMKIK